MTFDSEASTSEEVVQPPTRREIEWRKLPENPSHMTFRGRYDHVDAAVADMIHLEELPKGSKIRALDFAGGVLPFGAPTAHDLYDKISEAGLTPEITVVDKNIPPDLEPSYSDITYRTTLPEDVDQYHIIRALHVVEHMKSTDYQEIRRQLLERLSEGGLFISSQLSYRRYWYDSFDYDWDPRPTIIKIMQKRDDDLVPIMLLPDAAVPWANPVIRNEADPEKQRAEHLRKYAEFRKQVKAGERELDREPYDEWFKATLSTLAIQPPGVLQGEDTDTVQGNITASRVEHDLSGELQENQQEAVQWFAKAVQQV